MIKDCGGELSILIDQPLKDLQSKNIDEKIIEGIKNVREEKLFINPGYDGVYGEIGIFTEPELKKETIKKKKVLPGQKNLF